MAQRRTTIWGWGFEDEQPTPEQKRSIAKGIAESVGAADFTLDPEPRVEDIALRPPRITPPASLAGLCSTDTYDRAAHTYGKALPDVVRAVAGPPPQLSSLAVRITLKVTIVVVKD